MTQIITALKVENADFTQTPKTLKRKREDRGRWREWIFSFLTFTPNWVFEDEMGRRYKDDIMEILHILQVGDDCKTSLFGKRGGNKMEIEKRCRKGSCCNYDFFSFVINIKNCFLTVIIDELMHLWFKSTLGKGKGNIMKTKPLLWEVIFAKPWIFTINFLCHSSNQNHLKCAFAIWILPSSPLSPPPSSLYGEK